MHVFSLRRTTLQPRLFQQACRLASTHTRRANVRARAAAQMAAKNAGPSQRKQPKDEDDDDDGIRWFEQDIDTGEKRRVSKNPEELEAEELRQKIQTLEKELREYRSDMSDETLLAGLDPEDRRKVEKALHERKEREHEITSGLELSLELPPLSVPLLKRLNASLRDAALNPTLLSRRKDLWRWYCRAKHNIPALPRMIPEKAWHLLWHTQSQDVPTNPDRLLHMEQLLVDMATVDLELIPDQDIVYIQTLVLLGKIQTAFAHWQEIYDQTPEPDHALLALGMDLFAQNGQLDRAHELLLDFLERFPDKDPRVVLPLLTANAAAGNDHLAFALYLLLRSKLASAMTMDDYDTVALTFLHLDKKDLALAVFRDMMLQGNQSIQTGALDDDQQSRLYNAVFDRIGLLSSRAINAAEENAVSLSALSVMPHEWQNKYFYGSWLKKLIGMDQLDAASKVVELMYERGVEPDAKHINGLLGAFLRTGNPDLQDRGEKLAWSMIQQRLDFTWQRRQKKRGEPAVLAQSVYETEEGIKIPPHIARPVPRATVETFNILAFHYRVKEEWAHVRHLNGVLRPAEFIMSPFFMNQYLYMTLKTKDHKAMWHRFIKQAKWTNPDMETYNCLWSGQLYNLDTRKNPDRSGYPPPRQLFALMMAWFSGLENVKKPDAASEFGAGIYAKVIQSFCADKDYTGCLAALHGAAQDLGQYPDPDIARLIITSVSNLPEAEPPTIRGRRGRQQLPTSEIRLKNTSKVLTTLAKRRASAAMENGVDITQLEPEARQQESLNLLSEFIRVVLLRSSGKADSVESSIEQACREMQLEGISTGDIDASNVA